jgi:hypothetical protein
MEVSGQFQTPATLPPGKFSLVPIVYSSVGIALGYRVDDWGSRVRSSAGAGNFSLHHCVQNGSGAHPASYQMGSGALSRSKAAGARLTTYLLLVPKSKNEWSYTPLLQYDSTAWCSVKTQGQCYLFTHWVGGWMVRRANLDSIWFSFYLCFS